jgi:hypothetical protein
MTACIAVDILGREVEGFPVSLAEATTLGATVLDYDKNRNYRILVPAGAKLHNYSIEGQPIEGWKTDAASGTITQSPLLYQRGGKDYVIISTLERAHVVNRRGEERIQNLSPHCGYSAVGRYGRESTKYQACG